MGVTRACAEDLDEFLDAAADAVRGLEESVMVLQGLVLSDEDRRAEEQRCLDEAARLWASAQGLAERLALWPALGELRR